jgi:purine nucleosidase
MRMLIDTDVVSDGAVALVMAFRSPKAEVVAVTTVAGKNRNVAQATTNALVVAELCESGAPVYVGAEKPLQRAHADATFFYGLDGLGDQHYPAPRRRPEKRHGVDAIIETARRHDGLVLVTLGPLTNVALAVQEAPDIVSRISRCVVMGGAAQTLGNATPAAEYNIWADPEAARTTFLSGLAIEMVGWELCVGEAALSMDEVARVRALGTAFARFAVDCNAVAMKAFQKQTGQAGLALPDAVAMAVALEPTIVTEAAKHYVEIETTSELTRGMTIIYKLLVYKLGVAADPGRQIPWREAVAAGKNVTVTGAIDARRWKQILLDSLG